MQSEMWSEMKMIAIRRYAGWYALASGVLFLLVSTYLRMVFVFESEKLPGILLFFSMILAAFTLLLGLLSLPKWQAWIALMISCYAIYWLFFTRLYAIS